MTHVAVASPGTLTATSSRTRQGHLHGVHRYLEHRMSIEITESNSSARALIACIQGNVELYIYSNYILWYCTVKISEYTVSLAVDHNLRFVTMSPWCVCVCGVCVCVWCVCVCVCVCARARVRACGVRACVPPTVKEAFAVAKRTDLKPW